MKGLSYDNVRIVPQYSEVLSRELVSTKTVLHPNLVLDLPVISANMPNISGPKMAAAFSEQGGLTILPRHKNNPEFDIQQFLQANFGSTKVGASIGVKESDKDLYDKLHFSGCRIFCIDVAHGDHLHVKNMIKWIRDGKSDDIVLIAGNVATYDGTMHLAEWGADVIKVGIAPGKVCRTRHNTGVYVPQVTALMSCAEAIEENNLEVTLIADGGIERYGDVPKALIWAHAVMIGYLISGTSETPGWVFENEDELEYYKMYGGNASAQNKIENEGHSRYIEGTMIKVQMRGHVKYVLRKIKQGIQTACSFSNSLTLDEFHTRVKWEEE